MGSQHQTTLDYNSTMTSEIDAMSVYEDDMEVDAPSLRDTVMFSSDNTNSKGKRSAANLPVEAEDSLPW
jgi:hypothetical protein